MKKEPPLQGKDQYSVSYTVKNGKDKALTAVVRTEIGALVISGFGSYGQQWRSYQPFASKVDEMNLEPRVSRTVSTKVLVPSDAHVFAPGSIVQPRVTVEKVSD